MNKDYLAGFIEGEGCFTIILNKGRYLPHFTIQLRADDIHILKEIQKSLHINTKLNRYVPKTNAKPLVKLYLNSAENNLRLIAFLGHDPFVGRKKPQYKIWRKAVMYYAENKGPYPHADRQPEEIRIQLEEYYYQLKDLKKYYGGKK